MGSTINSANYSATVAISRVQSLSITDPANGMFGVQLVMSRTLNRLIISCPGQSTPNTAYTYLWNGSQFNAESNGITSGDTTNDTEMYLSSNSDGSTFAWGESWGGSNVLVYNGSGTSWTQQMKTLLNERRDDSPFPRRKYVIGISEKCTLLEDFHKIRVNVDFEVVYIHIHNEPISRSKYCHV